ncbi:hypothetical protein MMC26_000715 [Xylographa opegraphella]|nr:hypothetical protein [Xylographa opegraphella]
MTPIKKLTSRKRSGAGCQHSFIATILASNNKKLCGRLDEIIELLEVTASAVASKKEGSNVTQAAVSTTPQTATVDWDKVKGLTTSCSLQSEIAPPEANSQPQSRFMWLSQELRNQVYELVLVSSGPIIEPHRQMSEKRDDATTRIGDINSSLVMTCRLIYAEAMPVLYGTLNTFQFTHPTNIRLFSTAEGRRPADYIQRVALVLSKPYLQGFKGRAAEAKDWVDSLFSMFNTERMLLPRLEELELDLTSWKMQLGDAFPPSLVKGLKKRGWKVRKLVLRGLEDQPVFKELLEQTLLRTPRARLLTDENDQVLEVVNSSSLI